MADGTGYHLSEPMGNAIRSILEETAEAFESVNHYIWTLERRIDELMGVAREKVSEVA